MSKYQEFLLRTIGCPQLVDEDAPFHTTMDDLCSQLHQQGNEARILELQGMSDVSNEVIASRLMADPEASQILKKIETSIRASNELFALRFESLGMHDKAAIARGCTDRPLRAVAEASDAY